MKRLILFMIIFALGAITFGLFDRFIIPSEELSAITPSTSTAQQAVSEAQQERADESPMMRDDVVITADGSLLDGPFVLFDADGQRTNATVRQVISPEERLLQFQNFEQEYPLASRVYFANDKDATEYLNLGPAQMHDEYFVYGIPLDADLSLYSYVLIYDEQRQETVYYARIK
jgi:hypothetical protein